MASLTIRFSQNPDLLAKTIIFQAKSIQNDKFSQGNYLVLPRLLPQKRKAVHFPDLGYPSKFWQELSTLKDYSLTKPYPQFCLDFVTSKLEKRPSVNTQFLLQDWEANASEYLKYISNIFSPELLKKILSIEILLTEFGTPGTFSRTNSRGGPVKLICTARTDFPASNILQVIVNCLITITQPGYADVGTIGWYERNAVVNFLSKYSALAPKLPGLKEETFSPAIISESQHYLDQLGFPRPDTINIETIKTILTPQEKALVDCIYTNPGKITSFDAVATAVWGEKTDEKFSLYALAKIIESVRQKIKTQGINRELIHTHRKQGYQFVI